MKFLLPVLLTKNADLVKIEVIKKKLLSVLVRKMISS